MTRIGLGGGCHWCTEAVFAALQGIARNDQGFIKSAPPDDSWSEAILLEFDATRIPLKVLIEIHLRTHASTSNHKMRGKYRSAIYTFSREQAQQAERFLTSLQPAFDAPLVTHVMTFAGFKASQDRFRNYHEKHADGPFCTRYIDPKLDTLRRVFGDFVQEPLAPRG